MEKEYLKANYDINNEEIVSITDEISLWSAPFGQKILDTIVYRKGIIVLDIGCGTGFPLLEISQRLGDSSFVFGLDPWHAGIERATKKINLIKPKNVKIIEGIAEHIPFQNDIFNLIVSNNGLNNVTNQQQAINECFRVAKKGAQFVFSFNLPDTMIEFYTILKNTLTELNLQSEINKVDIHIQSKRKTIEETKNMVLQSGFYVKEVIEEVFYYKFVDGTAMLNYFFIKLAFLKPWESLVPPVLKTSFFEKLEQNLNRYADDLGLLKLSVPFAVFNCYK